MASKRCPKSKQITVAEGPKEIRQPIQYGPRIKAFAGYFHYKQLLPVKRCQEMFSDLFSLSISQGTLVNAHEKLYRQLEVPAKQIQNALLKSASLNCDETSMYVNGKTQWLHVACNEMTTAYFIHPKRGTIAMNDMNFLPHYRGIMVHDHLETIFCL